MSSAARCRGPSATDGTDRYRRSPGPAAARPAHLGHRSLQLPLHLLHAARDLWAAFRFLPHAELLTFEEMTRLAGVAVSLGVTKVRLTGGEPLLRRDVERLVRMLAAIDGLHDLTLTTNGSLLADKARALAEAGLRRVTVSLDSLDDAGLRAPQRRRLPGGPRAGGHRGRRPCRPAAHQGQHGRAARGQRGAASCPWPASRANWVHPALHRVHGRRPHQRLDAGRGRARPRRWSRPSTRRCRSSRSSRSTGARSRRAGDTATDGGRSGSSARSRSRSAGSCTRARLTAEGTLYTCLFGTAGTDLRDPLRTGATDEELRQLLGRVWTARGDRYSELRSAATRDLPRVEMSRIGG